MSEAPLLERVLAVVRSNQPLAREKGLELVGIVGSVARGEARPDSDVDVVYDVVGQPSYFDVAAVAAALEDALGRRVDMVGRRAMKPDRWAFMGRDLVAV
ncbi:MAG: nucleotidyltransferase domain-containing protein [Brevundimonas sp.]